MWLSEVALDRLSTAAVQAAIEPPRLRGRRLSASDAGREGAAALPLADGRLHVWRFLEAKGVVWSRARHSQCPNLGGAAH
jgi:hypothetical protein